MGIFNKIFGKKEQVLPPADLSVLKTDVHSHFIPGIDDGAKTIEDSLELIGAMEKMGYTKVITTPHIMSDYYRNTPEIILGGLDLVRNSLAKSGSKMQIEAAAEYYIDFDFQEKIKEKKLLTFGDNYVLFEMPFIGEPQILNTVIFDMQMAGYKPVLAHVERYQFWHHDYEKIQSMKDKGVLLQLNINSLSGYYSPQVRKLAEKMIDENMFDVLGSDCHHTGHIELMQKVITMPYFHKIMNYSGLINQSL
jgi:tyrosine-protein phosphatase YwqE